MYKRHYLIHFDEWLNQFDRTSLMHSEPIWTVLNHFDRFWSCNKALFTAVFNQHLDLADQNKVEQLPLGPFGPFGCWRVDHRFWTHFKRGSQNGNGWVSTSKHVLIGALEHFLFSIIDGIILPVDQYFLRWLKPPASVARTCSNHWWEDRSWQSGNGITGRD